MKRLFFGFVWQWRGGAWIGFNPIGIEFEYDKFEPSLTFKFVIMGIGFQVFFICPWDTQESLYARDCSNNMMDILSLGDEMSQRDRSGDNRE